MNVLTRKQFRNILQASLGKEMYHRFQDKRQRYQKQF